MSSMLNISIDDRGFQQSMSLLIARAGNLRPAFRSISEILIKSRLHDFEIGGDPPWKPSQKILGGMNTYNIYSGGHMARPKGGKTLIGDGTLRDRHKTEYFPNAVEITFGEGLPYTMIHQMSGWAGRGHKSFIPARRHVVIHPKDQERILNVLSNYILLEKNIW
jgi:phage gpG-like protein